MLSRTENYTALLGLCGDEGLAQLTQGELEYTNLRTAARTAMPRPGLYEAVYADNLFATKAIGRDRIIFSRPYKSSPLFGVRKP